MGEFVEQGDEYDDDHADLIEQLMATENVQEQVEILGFMKTRGFKPPTPEQGGPRRGPA